jgi:hypothetical protein
MTFAEAAMTFLGMTLLFALVVGRDWPKPPAQPECDRDSGADSWGQRHFGDTLDGTETLQETTDASH